MKHIYLCYSRGHCQHMTYCLLSFSLTTSYFAQLLCYEATAVFFSLSLKKQIAHHPLTVIWMIALSLSLARCYIFFQDRSICKSHRWCSQFIHAITGQSKDAELTAWQMAQPRLLQSRRTLEPSIKISESRWSRRAGQGIFYLKLHIILANPCM